MRRGDANGRRTALPHRGSGDRPDTPPRQGAGFPIAVTATEFALLQNLIEARGRVLTRAELLGSVHGYSNPDELDSGTIDVHLSRLREKLGPEAPRIVTVRRIGYRFEVE